MKTIKIEARAYRDLIAKIDAINNKIFENERWIDNKEFMRILNISKRTSQNYRDNGMIGYSQINNKVYYRLDEVQQLLKLNYFKLTPEKL